MIKTYITHQFLKRLEPLKHGLLSVQLWNGKTYQFGNKESSLQATCYIFDPKAISNLALKGDIGFIEGYRDKLWDCDNITNLILIALKNEEIMNPYIYGNGIMSRIFQVLYLFKQNTVKGSKKNIHAHYDLGNDFYSLWLDPSMTYSSALFKNSKESLYDAQQNKYDRILKQLESASGNLLEIGCGWGGFAERALSKSDFSMKGITISDKQYQFTKDRVGKYANILLEDYRIQTGKYDHIVSIEMFEAVGEKFWSVFFQKIKSLLAKQGKAVLQVITIEESYFEQYRKSGDIFRNFIFPGGMLPSIPRFEQETKKANLHIENLFSFGKDYATTIKHWLSEFESNLTSVKQIGFDDAFIRIWRFYLAACIAIFSTGRVNVSQINLVHE